jgi:alkylation response protein AidB-like acyl-CoA dehydrogenase
MALVLTEEQELLRDSARDFVANQWDFDWLRKVRKDKDRTGYDPKVWQQIVELGWAAIPFDEEVGGLNLGFAELGVVLEEMGRRLLVSPFLSTVVLGGGALHLGGSAEQKAAVLPGVCDGSLLLALAYQETARHDPYAVTTAATADGDGYRISGKKCLVLDGASANKLVVVARTSGRSGERDGLTLFLLDAGTTGLNVSDGLLLDSRSAAHVTLDNVQAAAADIVGQLDAGADVLDKLFANAAVAVSAEMLGGAQDAFDRTLEYLKEREQFGAKIGSFQGLKHRAARWFCEVELMRSIVMDALRAIDEARDDATQLASVCKARASDVYRLSSQEGIQMHGGIGVTDEFDIGFYLKRARVSELLLGDSAYHRNQFAQMRGY